MTQKTYNIYFAGALFNHKDLAANLSLAKKIEQQSEGLFTILLPQDTEGNKLRSTTSIRDTDFQLLFQSDLILANFDGLELDSGTVVEFCFAKMLDIPALVLRTDFRAGGDQVNGDEPWNLMCSGYPRTETLLINAMTVYHKFNAISDSYENCISNYHQNIAQNIILKLQKLISTTSWIKKDYVLAAYQNAIKSIGGELFNLLTDEVLNTLVTNKIEKGIY